MCDRWASLLVRRYHVLSGHFSALQNLIVIQGCGVVVFFNYILLIVLLQLSSFPLLSPFHPAPPTPSVNPPAIVYVRGS